MRLLAIFVMMTTPVLAAQLDPTPPPMSAPCAKEVHSPAGVCYHVPSSRHFTCLAAHRAELSPACQQLLKDNGK